jgi:glycosyltransferase involved in cell wall biosynthesis
LNRHDIIQVVAGSPAWAMLSRKVSKPVFLQVATLARSERQSRIGTLSGPRNLLVRTMTAITGQIEELALKHVHKVFVENTRMHRWVSHRKGTQAVVYALPGVDTNSFKPNGYKGKSYILAVGRFADLRKNPDMLFRAYAEIKKMMITPPQLVLAGNSMPPEKSIALAKELDIISHLQLYEKIDTAQLSKLYREASLFVLSSDEEGLGIVVLEAMASGLPVVATRCGGPEMVVAHGETGYLVNIRDHVELAQRMKDILTNSMLARHMGERGRKLIEKRFSLKAAGLAFLDAYDALPNLR